MQNTFSIRMFATGRVMPANRRIKKVRWMGKILIERELTVLDGVNSRIAMVKPAAASMSEVPDDQGKKGVGRKANMWNEQESTGGCQWSTTKKREVFVSEPEKEENRIKRKHTSVSWAKGSSWSALDKSLIAYSQPYCPGVHRCGVIKLKATAQIDIIVIRRRGVEQSFLNWIDDCTVPNLRTISNFLAGSWYSGLPLVPS